MNQHKQASPSHSLQNCHRKDNYIALNTHCFCVSLDEAALELVLRKELGSDAMYQMMRERCPHLFASHPIFIDKQRISDIQQLILAIENVVALPKYRTSILENAPTIVQHDSRHVQGVFFGYDFHINQEQLGLIEINTNAGGAMLNMVLARAQHACCESVQEIFTTDFQPDYFEAEIIAMFQKEWQLSENYLPLKSIAIVDDKVNDQYLYPEFLLFQKIFQKHGIDAVICNPEDLVLKNGSLNYQGKTIDLIYNRLTDFYLEQKQHQHLHQAYLDNAVVITPHPQVYALYADKKNLTILSNPQKLEDLGVPISIQEILLAHIPYTELVSSENQTFLWENRRQFFFKPHTGFGSRASYRGDKLTKKVWQEIVSNPYVAQTIIAPGERYLSDVDEKMKFDLRAYTYAGNMQWLAARLYQGQTTNFRTPKGGFAPVYPI